MSKLEINDEYNKIEDIILQKMEQETFGEDDLVNKMATGFVNNILDDALDIIVSRSRDKFPKAVDGDFQCKLNMMEITPNEGEAYRFVRPVHTSQNQYNYPEQKTDGQGDNEATDKNDAGAMWRCVGVQDFHEVTTEQIGSTTSENMASDSSDEELAAWEEANEEVLQVIECDSRGYTLGEITMGKKDQNDKVLTGKLLRPKSLEKKIQFSPLTTAPYTIPRNVNISKVPEVVNIEPVAAKKENEEVPESMRDGKVKKKKGKLVRRIQKLFSKKRNVDSQ